MMRHLILVAHPAEHSFTMALAHAYAGELDNLGQEQRTHDLYRMRFNPVLAANELEPVDAKHPPAADVAQAQDDVRAADVLTVVYPLWWMSMPAIMKGYIDRVFALGFAYEAENGTVRGLLSGKKMHFGDNFRCAAACINRQRKVECRTCAAGCPCVPFGRIRASRACPFRRSCAGPFQDGDRTPSGAHSLLCAATFLRWVAILRAHKRRRDAERLKARD